MPAGLIPYYQRRHRAVLNDPMLKLPDGHKAVGYFFQIAGIEDLFYLKPVLDIRDYH